MRMEAEPSAALDVPVHVVEEHERFDALADIAGARHPSNEAVLRATDS
jgi:hypothetical protein